MMTELTLKIKPNDQITLKGTLTGKFLLNIDKSYFKNKTVVVEATRVKWSVSKTPNKYDWQVNAEYHITVRDRAGISTELPISNISRNYCLRRDHKRISLHHKTLICENNG